MSSLCSLTVKVKGQLAHLYYNSACLSVCKEHMSSKEAQLKCYTCARKLKSVLDNSGSRQGQETANPSHESTEE